MNDIYDRNKWPAPEANPLVLMLQRGDDWYSNKEINAALDPARGVRSGLGSPMASLKTVMQIIGDGESFVTGMRGPLFTKSPARTHGGVERFYSRKAFILIALRARTANAAAFRDWLASRMDEEVSNG